MAEHAAETEAALHGLLWVAFVWCMDTASGWVWLIAQITTETRSERFASVCVLSWYPVCVFHVDQ